MSDFRMNTGIGDVVFTAIQNGRLVTLKGRGKSEIRYEADYTEVTVDDYPDPLKSFRTDEKYSLVVEFIPDENGVQYNVTVTNPPRRKKNRHSNLRRMRRRSEGKNIQKEDKS